MDGVTVSTEWMSQCWNDCLIGRLYSKTTSTQKMSLDSLIEGFLDTEFDEPVWSDSFIQRSLRTNLGYPIIAVNVLGLLWPADGNHRIAKCLLLGIAEIDAYVLENGQTMSYCEQPAMLA